MLTKGVVVSGLQRQSHWGKERNGKKGSKRAETRKGRIAGGSRDHSQFFRGKKREASVRVKMFQGPKKKIKGNS